ASRRIGALTGEGDKAENRKQTLPHPAILQCAIRNVTQMAGQIPYRDFYYPLNVLLHLLTLEEGRVDYLHYGLFEDTGEPIRAAQERSTELLLSRLPALPGRLLDVGVGLGTTLS